MSAYVAFVMILNFFVDLLVLSGTDRLLGAFSPVKFGIPGAAIGGVYAGICLLPVPPVLTGTAMRLAVLLVMAWLSYGFHLRRTAAFILVMLSLGGITTGFYSMGRGELLICLCCGIILIFCVKRRGKGTELVPLILSYGGKTQRVMALHDTGNGLRDPITGEEVIVVSSQVAYEFTGLTKQQLSQPLQSLQMLPGARLIPYHTVGTENGFLLAIRFPEVKLGRRSGSAIVAFAPSGFQPNGSFQALTGRVF